MCNIGSVVHCIIPRSCTLWGVIHMAVENHRSTLICSALPHDVYQNARFWKDTLQLLVWLGISSKAVYAVCGWNQRNKTELFIIKGMKN